jgi:hypothetical protein
MGFLDKVAQKTAAGGTAPAAAPKVNPLGGTKPNPFLKKPAEAPATTEKAETPKAEEKQKVNPFTKKKEAASETTVEEKATAAAEKKNPFGPKKQAPVANPKGEEVEITSDEEAKIAAQEDMVAEGNLGRDEEEVQKEMNPEPTETKTEKAADTKKTTNKGSRGGKGAAKTADPKPVAAETAPKEEPMPEITVNSFAAGVQALKSAFVDTEWEEFREATRAKIDAIVIDPDMNPAVVKQTLAELSAIKDELWLKYADTKALVDRLCEEKPEGLIERTKRINLGTGTNDLERRKAGVLACMRYESNEEILNLYEIADEAKDRLAFFTEVINQVKYKSSVLITYSGAMKLDKDLMPN